MRLGVVACFLLAAACSSSNDETSDPGGAGASGGGGGATGGTAGTGGDAGSSGSAGAAASGGTGGSSGSSGASGSGGTDTGGSGGDAGNAGSGATGGTSGSGGGTTTPRCDDLCDDIIAANCSEGPSLDGCLITCKALTSSSACDDLANDYFDCTDTATIECNGKGEPVAPGCGVQYLVAIDCAVTENPNPDIVAPCSTYCDLIVGQACTNGPTTDECNTNCLWLGATGTGCDDEWAGYLECANAATWSCILGYAVPFGCGQPWQAYTACIDAAGGT